MRRRDFIKVTASLAVARPLAAQAQQGAMPVIGELRGVSLPSDYAAAFRQGLAEAGFIEGRNVTVQERSAEGQYDRLPALAAELVRDRVAVIVASTPVAALAAKAATTTIPIVFEIGSDPVKDGLVANLARPGGNVTGVTFFANLLTAKRLELLHEIVPRAAVVGFLLNPTNADAELELKEAETAAQTLGLRLVVARATSVEAIDDAFAEFVRQHIMALLISGDAYLNLPRIHQIAALALRHAIATCGAIRSVVTSGVLASYGANRPASLRQSGIYAGRVLKGEKPADMPVVQPTQFEIAINLATAKALGLSINRELLLRADEVIE
jgi:putative ABC transport system substrate-binding protein